MINTTIYYNNSESLTYDTNEIAVNANDVRLKKLGLLPNELFCATAKLGEAADRFTGTDVMTPVGTGTGMTTFAGKQYYNLDVAGGARYYSIVSSANYAITNNYTIRMKVLAKYNGSPAANSYMLLTNSGGTNTNAIILTHLSTGDLRLQIYSSTGVPLTISAPWSPTMNGEYEIEIGNSGTSLYLFVDGVLLASSAHTTVAGNRATFRIGTDVGTSGTSKFLMRDLQIFNTVQHTGNFSSEIPRVVNLYSNSAKVESASYLIAQGFTSMSANETGNIKWIVKVENAPLYLLGGVLIASDGTYIQANTITELNTGNAVISAYIANGARVNFIPVLNSGAEGATESVLISADFFYDFFAIPNDCATCFVYGFLTDNCVDIVTGTVRFFSKKPFAVSGSTAVIDVTVNPEAGGFYGTELIIPDNNYPINFEMNFTDVDGKVWKDKGTIIIPQQPTATVNSIRQ